VAGAAEMTYRNFAIYNVVGALLWVLSMTLTGYFLAAAVPDIDKQIHKVVAVVIFLSLLPPGIAWLKGKMGQKKLPATTD
jgi:membrane-associated protein